MSCGQRGCEAAAARAARPGPAGSPGSRCSGTCGPRMDGKASSRPWLYGCSGRVEHLRWSAPSSATWPAYITASRSEKWLTSDMSWVTKMIANPSSRCSSLICTISERWATTSSAEVGSSMMTSSGVNSMAIAIIARCRIPPRQLVRVALQVHRVDADHAQDLGRSVGDLAPRAGAVGPLFPELGADRLHRVERVHRALHDHRQSFQRTAASSPVGQPDQVLPAKRDAARRRSRPAAPAAGRSRTAGSTCRSRTRRPLRGTRPPRSSKLTWSTARTGPGRSGTSTVRSRTSRMALRLSAATLHPPPAHRPQGRVPDLVEGVVEQRERPSEQRRCRAPGTMAHRYDRSAAPRCFRPVEHRAPARSSSSRRGR